MIDKSAHPHRSIDTEYLWPVFTSGDLRRQEGAGGGELSDDISSCRSPYFCLSWRFFCTTNLPIARKRLVVSFSTSPKNRPH